MTWDSLIEADKIPAPLEEGEMTPAMYAKMTGKSQGWACNRLAEYFLQGTATRRRYGIHSWAYRLK